MTEVFGQAPDGSDVLRCVLRNGGSCASVLTWGATLQAFRLDGVPRSLILGGSDLQAYLGPMRYFGAIVGPVANRISQGRMSVDGKTCDLDKNERGVTTLHSGIAGFDARNWHLADLSETSCTLSLIHPDGLGGFPGTIEVRVVYHLEADGALMIEVTGQTDQPTFFSPAFHGYWNLTGSADLKDHALRVPSAHYLAVDDDQIPLGDPQPVAETAFDYRDFSPIRDNLDHNFCLDADGRMQPACQLQAGGLTLDVSTDQPGVQVYNGAHISTEEVLGHEGKPYGRCAGLAIEPQFWPDTPNRPDFPSSLLRPGKTARHRSRFHVTRA
jgi:aldose 1-epimerase